jgi:ribosome-binding protein aMBF1 (putative translation factor)
LDRISDLSALLWRPSFQDVSAEIRPTFEWIDPDPPKRIKHKHSICRMFAASKFGFAGEMAHTGNHREIVGKNIRACRTKARLTLEKLAEKAEMSWPYLSEIERGRENISLDKLAQLAQALNVTLSELVENA